MFRLGPRIIQQTTTITCLPWSIFFFFTFLLHIIIIFLEKYETYSFRLYSNTQSELKSSNSITIYEDNGPSGKFENYGNVFYSLGYLLAVRRRTDRLYKMPQIKCTPLARIGIKYIYETV